MYKALILDLDNTIYPVSAIGDELFSELFSLIARHYVGDMEPVKREIMRTPFQKVAARFGFSRELKTLAHDHLTKLEYNQPIAPFPGYALVRGLAVKKFLLTTGYRKLQQSKIDALGIRQDFDGVHIVDPGLSQNTKKDIMSGILSRFRYAPEDILVVGDDPHAEIAAAQQLGIRAILFSEKIDQGNSRDDITVVNSYPEMIDLITRE